MGDPGKNYKRCTRKTADSLIIISMSKWPQEIVQVEVPEETSKALHTKSGLLMSVTFWFGMPTSVASVRGNYSMLHGHPSATVW